MNAMEAKIVQQMHRRGFIPCSRCASEGRFGVRATQKVGKRMVCTGCAREIYPDICARGCGRPAHTSGCNEANAVKRVRK